MKETVCYWFSFTFKLTLMEKICAVCWSFDREMKEVKLQHSSSQQAKMSALYLAHKVLLDPALGNCAFLELRDILKQSSCAPVSLVSLLHLSETTSCHFSQVCSFRQFLCLCAALLDSSSFLQSFHLIHVTWEGKLLVKSISMTWVEKRGSREIKAYEWRLINHD